MRAFLPIIFFCSCFQTILSQNDLSYSKVQLRENAKIVIVDNPHQDELNYLKDIKYNFGLGSKDELSKISSLYNISGFTREKYQQFHKGFEVIGAKYILHEKDGVIHKSTGRIAPFISINENPSLTETQVKNIAYDFMMNELLEDELKSFDVQFNFHDIKLCIIDKSYPKFTGNYKLAYQIFAEANTIQPIHEKLYIDAHTGKVLSNFTEVCDHSVPGKVKTRYYGTQDIIADSVGVDMYVLRDSTRGQGVFTVKGPQKDFSTSLEYPDFYDDDNIWDNVNNDFDEVAGDAHYCASSYYDMLSKNFGWNGLNNSGLPFVTVVHASRRYYVNAYWNGDKVFVGNGNCDQYGPLTTLDVIGHEYTHGIIDYTCNLVYQDESGALNESLADIFGKTLEYKFDRENFNWLIGSKFRIEDPEKGFRDMKDPPAAGDPKFYLGDFWHTSSSDRGGVHTNSGVFNYWYYLLVEGAVDTNQVDYIYDVEAIGIDDAMQIAFGCMSGYFSEDTNYPEAMRLSLQMTKDLFTENSTQYRSVLEAWKAVGLYPGIDDHDWSLEFVENEYFGCPDEDIIPEVLILNTGIKTQPAGTELELSYVFDGGFQEVFENYTLTEDVLPGDTIFYTFSQAIEYEEGLRDDIILYLHNIENIELNNKLKVDLEYNDMVGSDIVVRDFELTFSDVCNPTAVTKYKIELTNNGCKPITSEDTVVLKITTDLEERELPFQIFSNLDPGNVTIAYRNFSDALESGFSSYSAELYFNRDEDSDNNFFSGELSIPEGILNGYLEEFNESNYREKLNFNTKFSAQDSVIEYNGSKMYAIARTGSNASVSNCSTIEDVFNENSKQSEIDACLDARGMEEPYFSMDIVQIRNGIDEELPEEFRTIVKVSNDELDYPLIYNQPNGQVVYHEFPLPIDYVGNFEIEVFVYSRERDAFDPIGLEALDAVLFDNLEFLTKQIAQNHQSLLSIM